MQLRWHEHPYGLKTTQRQTLHFSHALSKATVAQTEYGQLNNKRHMVHNKIHSSKIAPANKQHKIHQQTAPLKCSARASVSCMWVDLQLVQAALWQAVAVETLIICTNQKINASN
jgi:hypothetical protein